MNNLEYQEQRIRMEMKILRRHGYNPRTDERTQKGFCSAWQADRILKKNTEYRTQETADA